MHLNEALVREGATPALDTVLGKTGNTGKMTDLVTKKETTYKAHAHEDVYTENLPSPYLDYLTGKTSGAAARIFYGPENRFFYDKFLFADKQTYTIDENANTYNW
jgi:hypothetical protein